MKRYMKRLVLTLTVIAVLFMVALVCFWATRSKEIHENEFNADTYLAGDSAFDRVAITVLPSSMALKNAQVTNYEYVKRRGEEWLCISIVYSEKNFEVAKQRAEGLYPNEKNKAGYDTFYLDGQLYEAYMFYVDKGRYVMGYHIDTEQKAISYILSENPYYEYLTVVQSFETTFGESRITEAR